MPKYNVIERRAYTSAYLIEASDEDAAKGLQGDVLDEISTDSWGDETISVEQVDDDADCAELQ